jgi:hypothetical protein
MAIHHLKGALTSKRRQMGDIIESYNKRAVPWWNLPLSVLKRWIGICMTQKWSHHNSERTFCARPLDLNEGEILESIISYASNVWKQVQDIFEDQVTEQERESSFTRYSFPVRVPGAWILYLTQRQTHAECVIRLNKCYRESSEDDRGLCERGQPDLHAGKSFMTQWLTMLAQQFIGQDIR